MWLKNWNLFGEGKKTLLEKEKMLVTNIFSFFHNVFKSPLSQGHLKSGLCGKELKWYARKTPQAQLDIMETDLS